MLTLLNRARTKRDNGEDGFTLIELLVVVVILGILIAIAIPVYLNYRKSANDKAAQSDLRNAISTLEVCNSDNAAYPSAVDGTTGALTGCDSQSSGVKLSTNSTVRYVSVTPFSSYTLYSTNSGGSTKVYCYNSANGGGVKDATLTSAKTMATATCS